MCQSMASNSKAPDNVRFPLSAVFRMRSPAARSYFAGMLGVFQSGLRFTSGTISDLCKECKNPILNFQNRVLEFFGSLFFEWMHRVAFWVSRSDAERERE